MKNFKVYYPCRPDTFFDTVEEAIGFQATFGGIIYYKHENGNYYYWG